MRTNDKFYWLIIAFLLAIIIFNFSEMTEPPTKLNHSNDPITIIYDLEPDSLQDIISDEEQVFMPVKIDTVKKDSIIAKSTPKKIKKTPTQNKNKKFKYSISEKGKNFIKEKESLKLKAYRINGEKLLTIGYGHQIQKNESYKEIDKATAEAIFEKDIEKINESINRILSNVNSKFEFTQGFIDGLGSLIYNCGESGVKKTEFYSRLKKCRYDASTSTNINKSDLSFTLSAVKTTHVYMKGHKARRIEEHNLMKS